MPEPLLLLRWKMEIWQKLCFIIRWLIRGTWMLSMMLRRGLRPLSHSVVVPASVPTPVTVPAAPVAAAPTQPVPKAVAPATASSRALWNNLFKSQPSLFPTR